MDSQKIKEEILPLYKGDSFIVSDLTTDRLNYPLHYHSGYEITLILNGRGLKRITGDSIEVTEDNELILIGPNLIHGWETYNCKSKANIITIHFPFNLFTGGLLDRDLIFSLQDLFKSAAKGVVFSGSTTEELTSRFLQMIKLDETSFLSEVISILQYLALSPGHRILSTSAGINKSLADEEKMALISEYIIRNFHQKITLQDASSFAGMSQISFNRFIKKHTNTTFVHYLNEFRISFAARQLVETDTAIAEIAYKCGFNNIANFNRIFKSITEITPIRYREKFYGTKRYL